MESKFMKKALFLLLLLASWAHLAPPAGAQPKVPSTEPQPIIGVISDEVARQRLRAAGIDQVAVVKREGDRIILRGAIDGQRVTLQMNALNGNVVDPRHPARRIVIPRTAPDRVAGPQVTVPQSRMSDAELMRGAVTPLPKK
jgi:hypothetical protein